MLCLVLFDKEKFVVSWDDSSVWLVSTLVFFRIDASL